MQVLIAGKGVISAIGNNVQETLTSLINLRTGVDKISVLRTNYSSKLPAAVNV